MVLPTWYYQVKVGKLVTYHLLISVERGTSTPVERDTSLPETADISAVLVRQKMDYFRLKDYSY